MGEWNNNIQIFIDKSIIEVSKSKEELDILDFYWFRSFLDDFDFVVGHGEPRRRKNISEIFYQLRIKFIFLSFYIKSSFP